MAWDHVTCDWAYWQAIGELPPSWALSEKLRREGVAILVPSLAIGTRSHDTNLVFWQWGGQPALQVAVIDDYAHLPSDQRSWP